MDFSSLLSRGKSILDRLYSISFYNKCQELLKRVEDCKNLAIDANQINNDNFDYVVTSIDREIQEIITYNDQKECESMTNDKINETILKYVKEYDNFKKITNTYNSSSRGKSKKKERTNSSTDMPQMLEQLSLQSESNNSSSSKRVQLTQKQLKNISLGTVKFNNPFPNTANASICVDYFPKYIDNLTTQVIKNIYNLNKLDVNLFNMSIDPSDTENYIPFYYTLVCKLLYNSDHNLTEKTFKSINEIYQMSEEGITRKIWEGVQKILYYQSIINNSIISNMLPIPELNENDKEALVTLLEFIKNNKSNLKRSYFYKINEFIMNL
jgi:hypothetical protein